MSNNGSIDVIIGPMYSGKSSELIRRVTRELIAERRVQAYKFADDKRYSESEIASHDGAKIKANSVVNTTGLLSYLKDDTEVVAVDEVQFLDDGIIELAEEFAKDGKRVILAGLNLDFRGEPFKFNYDSNRTIADLVVRADHVINLKAVCMYKSNGVRCTSDASRSMRLLDGEPAPYEIPVKFIGAKGDYEARCLEHHVVPGKPGYEKI